MNTPTTIERPTLDVVSIALLADALQGLIKLLDDGDLIRNTDGDADVMVFMRQGVKITNALRSAQEALEMAKSAKIHEVFGVIVQSGTDHEIGRPRLTIETTEQQLRDLSISPYGKQCRVEVLAIIPSQLKPLIPNLEVSDSRHENQ